MDACQPPMPLPGRARAAPPYRIKSEYRQIWVRLAESPLVVSDDFLFIAA